MLKSPSRRKMSDVPSGSHMTARGSAGCPNPFGYRIGTWTAFLICGAVAALPAQTLSTLATFTGANGYGPGYGALVQATDGNFYGTTSAGGASYGKGSTGGGTVFKIAPGGGLTTLYSFCSQPSCTDGQSPYSGLVQASDGNFYGTTFSGGASNAGTVFKITPAGNLTTLYSFCLEFRCSDGKNPEAGLMQASDGNLYGTTVGGGAIGEGSVFKITPGGALTTLYSFCSQANCADGAGPWAGLIQARDGNFYGTTATGGVGPYYIDTGTIFRMTPGGTLTTLYTFCSQANCADGLGPEAGLIEGSDGNFYGTTAEGGSGYYPEGTIFKITPGGTLTTLYDFCSLAGCADGEDPAAGLIQTADGGFYGSAFTGANNGTI
jgi:uncharacterized repeat protein (TIGR03803 family)